MYKTAILGCENSHANTFLDLILKDKKYTDVEVVGIYSDDTEAAEKLSKTYGLYIANSYDEFIGKVDGVIITARHGDNHYKYAKPYLASGIPFFIDKPITNSEEDALNFKSDLIKNNCRVCGGSVLKFPAFVQELKKAVSEKAYGKVYGGLLRAPINMKNDYGDFFFYSQHLVQAMCEIFGYFPEAVKAFVNGDVITCVVRYSNYDVTIVYTEKDYSYYAGINCEEYGVFSAFSLDGCFVEEFDEFYKLLKGEPQNESYEEFFAPVFILNAIDRSIKSNKEEPVNKQ